MRGILRNIASLGIFICAALPLKSQILIPEELQAASNLTLLQSAGNRLWVVQPVAENSGVITYSLAYKLSGVWKRLPAFKLVAQINSKSIEFTDIELYNNRIYLSGNFTDPNTKNNCLMVFDITTQTWHSDRLYYAGGGSTVTTITSLTLANDALFMGGNFIMAGATKANFLAKIIKNDLFPVKIKTSVGANAPVIAMESDSTQKVIYISGIFRNILGMTSTGFSIYRPQDSTFLTSPVSSGTLVIRMRNIGSKLLFYSEDSSNKEKKIFFMENNSVLTRAAGIDSLYSVTNIFSNKGNYYFSGEAQAELDVRAYGIFRISTINKTERLYRQFYKVFKAEGFEGNIYVYGYFVRLFTNASIAENFNLARIEDNFKRFYGRVFQDNSPDGKYQASTDKLAGGNSVNVYANGSFQFTIPVEKNGYFSFIIPTKNAIVFKAIVEKTPELKTISNYMFRSDTFNERVVDFPVQYLSSSYNNVRVRVTAAAGWQIRKDTSELYVIRVVNTGLVAAQPDITLSVNGKIQAIQSDPAPFQIDPGQSTKLTWKLSKAILPGEESSIMVKLTAPSTDFTNNDHLDFNAGIANFTDNYPADNTDTLQQTVISSLDANSKFQYPEIPSGENFAWLDPNAGKIEYIIRFTNITTDTIGTVVVRDTISTPDYVTYIQETGASHPYSRLVYTTPYLPNKVIVAYTFSNLTLTPNPLGNSELLTSSGYIGFRLGLKPMLASGTDLANRACIYLGTEEPIMTKTVNAKVATLGIKNITHKQTKNIYPNPFDNTLYFEGSEAGEIFSLYDMQGKKLVESVVSDNKIDLENLNLTSGIYMWTSRTRSGEVFSGLVSKK
ncbi:MAG: T9SS type A sorting domain-containing protein [Bacteroidetes bacterium]|nr:T9SS type A sorting domain-containing protein [Bacteroidota bacterium]